ncbi:MAG: DUF3108 domain-containing protein [Candidatus Cloacimonadaceae bacterium]|jgi:hypothetical protein|nr:DUF3108 domain-containing protein [Candidatus Cloacimonadota bacterium]MDY0127084.1 DUF3108 domain-containing protein [Candidatus Cloacimonadaceae bacterium]MCB5255693.1 DUF3108 domain-containing protein [Candidatus Cloacimonadota bacterium]MCK9177767.1 DUF3108 domain-containing protein [Candidatus Cloacimonadota bacterium]MCK9241759.1 DUF3108 domain-containing protein [Candidatus Cloacimonadota bacterium]
MRKAAFCLILLLYALTLSAISAEYKISSFGIKVADLRLEFQANKAIARVQNSGKVWIFPHINNLYELEFDDQFLPHKYLRTIHQGELRDSVLTLYAPPLATMHRKSSGEQTSYRIDASVRDFFSFLSKLCRHKNIRGNFLLDGNGAIWQANVSAGETDEIKTAIGKVAARKHEISLKPLSQEKAPYVDMLTHNFLSEDTRMSIWVSEQGLPVKAQLKKKAWRMNWDIESIHK